ncbi:MAG: hypothetical protein R3C11_08995 [Planctomycetaceae bacterium]
MNVDRSDFDWTSWQRLPVLDEGRIKPIDTFAEEVVTLVTGKSNGKTGHRDHLCAAGTALCLDCDSGRMG